MAIALLLLAAPPQAFAADREAGAKSEIPGAPVFMKLQPIVLPVIEGKAVTRQVGILLTLELAEGHDKESVEPQRARIMDAFINELYRIYGWRSNATQVVNDRLIKERLLHSGNQVLGGDVIRAVLIRQIVEEER